MTRVLLVEDDTRLRAALRGTFRAASFEVLEARTGEEALAIAAGAEPDLVVLDLNLPAMNGVEVLQHLRVYSQVPVVVLTVRDQIEDKVEALNAGGDDYVVKPFHPEELLARVRAHLRRNTDPAPKPAVMRTGALVVDLGARRVSWNDVPVSFTPLEFRLLEVLVANNGRLLTREELLSSVWNSRDDGARARLRATMVSLRKKLHDDASDPRLIVTEPGLGYRWIAEPDAAG